MRKCHLQWHCTLRAYYSLFSAGESPMQTGPPFNAQVGNAVTDGRQIVIGMGSSMLINAAMYAFSNASRSPEGMGHYQALREGMQKDLGLSCDINATHWRITSHCLNCPCSKTAQLYLVCIVKSHNLGVR